MAELADILRAAVAQKASDIFIVPNQAPLIKRAGALIPLQGFERFLIFGRTLCFNQGGP